MAITAREMGPTGLRRHMQEVYSPERQIRSAATTRIIRIYREDWRSYVSERIEEVFVHAASKEACRKHISLEHNLLRRVTHKAAVAYNDPPRRQLTKMAAASNKALHDALAEAEMDCLAEEWTRLAFAAGVVHVVPKIVQSEHWPEKRLQFDTILPHDTEALFEEDDPTRPAILIYRINQGDKRWIALDSEAWNYYDDNWKWIKSVPHGVGRMPAVQFRVRARPDDYWDYRNGDKLAYASIDVARITSHLRWTRQNSNSMIAALFCREIDDGSQSSVTAETPLALPVSPAEAQLTVHDYITPVKEWHEEIAEIERKTEESYGINLDADGKQGPEQHAQLAKLRNSQIKHLVRAERELVYTAAQMMAFFGHPLAKRLPAEKVRTAYTVEFPLLSYVDEPEAALRVSNELVKQAQSDPVEEYMRKHPGITWDEAHARVLHHIEVRGEITEFQAKHGISNDPKAEPKDDRDNKAQQEGRIGGQASPPPESDDDGDTTE